MKKYTRDGANKIRNRKVWNLPSSHAIYGNICRKLRLLQSLR